MRRSSGGIIISFFLVILVLYVAHYRLDYILKSDDTCRTAVFVNHNAHTRLEISQELEHVRTTARFGNIYRLTQKVLYFQLILVFVSDKAEDPLL